jgi:hypothetical protein
MFIGKIRIKVFGTFTTPTGSELGKILDRGNIVTGGTASVHFLH